MDLLTELSFCQDSRIFRDSLSLTLFFYIYIYQSRKWSYFYFCPG